MDSVDPTIEIEPAEVSGDEAPSVTPAAPAVPARRTGTAASRRRGQGVSNTPEQLAKMRARAALLRGIEPPHGWSAKRRKIESILKPEHRSPYEALIRDPMTTNESALLWLRAKGYRVGRGAIRNHRQQFTDMMRDLRQAARFADALGDLARTHGPATLSDLALTRLQQVVMERLMADGATAADGSAQRLEIKELGELAKIIRDAVTSRREMDALKQAFDQSKRQAATAAMKSARSGADGAAVALRVREILGIPTEDSDDEAA